MFLLLHSTDPPATTWPASFVTRRLFLLPLYFHVLISHYWPPMTCPVVLNVVVSASSWKLPFLLHSSSLVIQNYFSTAAPSLCYVWSKVEAHLCKVLIKVHKTPFSRHQKKIVLPFSSWITFLLEDANPLLYRYQPLSDYPAAHKRKKPSSIYHYNPLQYPSAWMPSGISKGLQTLPVRSMV